MKKTAKFVIILMCIIFFTSVALNSDNREGIYGDIAPEDYVAGIFNPAKSKMFISLKKAGVPSDDRTHYLRLESALALKRMIADFKKDNRSIDIFVISSTRNFYSQKSIWEAKWNGKRKVDGVYLNKTGLDPVVKGKKILRYSSMPGTSRHHWGTDFDLNNLNNSYFESGDGKVIYNWLNKNAAKYGFYQPYTPGRDSGYEEEKWHWSYLPLAKKFYEDWIKYYNKDNRFIVRRQKYAGSESLYKLSIIYVESINPECK